MSHPHERDWNLTREEFADALRKGLGRAVLHVQRHGAANPLDLIIEACATDQRYDKQCERNRQSYLQELAALSGGQDVVRDHLVTIARESPLDADIWHPLGVLGWMARQGDKASLAAIRERFERDAARGNHDSADAMIVAAPNDGLVVVASALGADFAEDDRWGPGAWLNQAGELDGAAMVTEALKRAAEHDARAAAFLDLAEQPRESFYGQSSAVDAETALPDDVRDFVFNPEDPPKDFHSARWRAKQWGWRANEAQRLAAARTLIEEPDSERVAVLCYVFLHQRTPFPLDIAPLIERARTSTDDRERYCLLRTIAPFDAERVRELALDLLNRCGPDSDILDLFIENYRPGDGEMIMRALAARPVIAFEKEFDSVHGVAMAIFKIFGDDERTDGREPLLWAYAHTPCSLCRDSTVRALIGIDAAPDWLLQECLVDCSNRTREYAAKAIAGESIDDE